MYHYKNDTYFQLGIGSKLISDEYYKPLDMVTTAWQPLHENNDDDHWFWIIFYWGIHDESVSNCYLDLIKHIIFSLGSSVGQPPPTNTDTESDEEIVKPPPVGSSTIQVARPGLDEKIIKYICKHFGIARIKAVSTKQVSAELALACWKMLQRMRNQMEELGWRKSGTKNVYVMDDGKYNYLYNFFLVILYRHPIFQPYTRITRTGNTHWNSKFHIQHTSNTLDECLTLSRIMGKWRCRWQFNMEIKEGTCRTFF